MAELESEDIEMLKGECCFFCNSFRVPSAVGVNQEGQK